MCKDIFAAACRKKDKCSPSLFTNLAHFFSENGPFSRIIADCIDRRQHLFIVVDEYGTMTAAISMEDVLERIFGHPLLCHSLSIDVGKSGWISLIKFSLTENYYSRDIQIGSF